MPVGERAAYHAGEVGAEACLEEHTPERAGAMS